MNNHEYDKVSVQTEHIFNLLFLIAIIGVVIGKEVSMLILDKKYYSALNMFPIITIGALGSCMWQIWVRNIAYVHKTAIISIFAMMGLLLNVGLNYWFLPLCGYTIAAWTTVASYILMGFASIVMTNLVVKHCRVTLTDKLIKVSAIIILYFLLKELPFSFFFCLFFKLLLLSVIMFTYRNTILKFGKVVR
jgi:O-antigen/teichoic acid export membrane protein